MSPAADRAPQPLASHHDLSRFRCRSPEQTDWLRRRARQSAGAASTLDDERRGLGAASLQDVFTRLNELSDEIGCRGLLIHAEALRGTGTPASGMPQR